MGKENQSHHKEHYDGHSSLAVFIPHDSHSRKKHKKATVYEQKEGNNNRWDIRYYALKPDLTLVIKNVNDPLRPDFNDLNNGEPIDELLSFIHVPKFVEHNGDTVLSIFDAAFSSISDEALYRVYIELSDIAQEKIQYLLHNTSPPDYADRVTVVLQNAIDSID